MKSAKALELTVILASVMIILTASLGSSMTATGHEALPVIVREPVRDAAATYEAKCAFCHGKDGRGLANWKAKGQPDFTNAKWQKSRTDAQIADAIRNGKGKFMPAWKGKLSDEDINALVGRVRAFGRK